ncbi:MAG: hypothetical protein KJ558_01565 [Gammaproteobacteria bacterium]|nr:hypothetical protein [Gammaproteobacteria bacterium]MBU1653525.1 hypothetical protein [Gammaproteobacteria bacterium]MBU1962554.1 hypothetical protein [Gammaproteobacteria bacterium]
MQPRVIAALSPVLALGPADIEVITAESVPALSQEVAGGTVIPFKAITLTLPRTGRASFKKTAKKSIDTCSLIRRT